MIIKGCVFIKIIIKGVKISQEHSTKLQQLFEKEKGHLTQIDFGKWPFQGIFCCLGKGIDDPAGN